MVNNLPANKERGVVILFAVLLVSVVLGISLGLLNISYRQIILSSVAQESTFAYFAADSAQSCALYWDFHPELDKRPFGSYELKGNGKWDYVAPSSGITDIACAGGTWEVEPSSARFPSVNYSGSFSFTMTLAVGTGADQRLGCALVEVGKHKVGGGGQERRTEIWVSGYNRGTANECPNPDANRVVERSLLYTREG
jgi:hypothetical protein